MTTKRIQPYFYLCFLLFLCLGNFILSANEAKSELQGWRKKRAEIFAQIEQELAAKVAAEVHMEDAAASLAIPLPIVKPERSVSDAFVEIRKKAEEAARAARPIRELQSIVHDAERLFPLYKVGDRTSVRLRTKVYPIASGIVNAISNERVQIGSRWIPIQDIAEEQRFAFDEQKTTDLRQNYVMRQNSMQFALFKNASDELFLKLLPTQMRQAGYVPINTGSEELPKPENWLSHEIALQQEWSRLRKEASEKLRPEIEKKRFAENRFKYYQNKKEWRPAGMFQSLKNLFD
ncbi:MAG: hypothetical protein WCT05_02490 [Lentisphaeria bacterium]